MKILLLGDSLFAGWEGQLEPHINYSLKQAQPDLEIWNLAESGDNSFDLLEKLDKTEICGADLVFVWIGANDLATHKQVFLGEFQDNLHKIVNRLRESYSAHQITFWAQPLWMKRSSFIGPTVWLDITVIWWKRWLSCQAVTLFPCRRSLARPLFPLKRF